MKTICAREAHAEAAEKNGGTKAKGGSSAKVAEKAVDPRDEKKEAEKAKRQRDKRESDVMGRIEWLESRNNELDAELCKPDVFSDPVVMRKLNGEKKENATELETLYAELDSLGQQAQAAA